MALSLADHIVEVFSLPSTLDWCENNYEVTPLLAEFWNTMSSFAMVFFGLFGLYMHGHIASRFALLYSFFTLVGVGSILFHGTLRFPFQVLDEVPMLWTSYALAYIMLEPDSLKKKYGWHLSWVMTIWAATATILSCTHGKFQFYFFQTSYLINQIFALSTVSHYAFNNARAKGTGPLWGIALRFYILAVVVWLIDLNFCHVLSDPSVLPVNPQLHAWWHVFAGYGSYVCCMMVVLNSMEVMGADCAINYALFIIPYVTVLSPYSPIMSPKIVKGTNIHLGSPVRRPSRKNL